MVDYVEEHWGRRFAAAFVEGVRLIDNVPIATTQGAAQRALRGLMLLLWTSVTARSSAACMRRGSEAHLPANLQHSGFVGRIRNVLSGDASRERNRSRSRSHGGDLLRGARRGALAA